MIRWFSGRLEANYVGDDSQVVLPGRAHAGTKFHPRLFRAAVRELTWISPPADAQPPALEKSAGASGDAEPGPSTEACPELPPAPALPAEFRQRRLDQAHIAEARGPGTFFTGPLFDVRVTAVKLTHPVEKGGRAYGRMVGEVIACCVLPPLPEPERVPPSEVAQSAQPAPAGTLHIAQGEPKAEHDDASPSERDIETEPAPRPAAQAGFSTGLSLLGAAALVAVALGVRAGGVSVALWCMFVLPTLLARRMLRGVLPEGLAMRVVGFLLVALQIACTSVLLSKAGPCSTLALAPLLGVIVVLFPSGLVPSAIPLVCNAAGLALVLFSYGGGSSADCARDRPAPVAPRE